MRGRRHELTLQMLLQIDTQARAHSCCPHSQHVHTLFFFSLLMCGPGCKFLGSFMLIPISISGVNKALQLGLMRLYHREGSSEAGGEGWMTQSPSSKGGKDSNTKTSRWGFCLRLGVLVILPVSVQEVNHQKLQNKSLTVKKKMNPNFLLCRPLRRSFEDDAARVASFQALIRVAHNTHAHTHTHSHSRTDASRRTQKNKTGALCGQSRWGQMGRQRGGPH